MYKIKNTRLISESRISIYTKYFIVPEDTQFYNYSSKIFQTKQQIQLKHKVLFILIEGTKE
ncbi:hypothetical protein, partial [Phocaeicola vulgatus]|uniref:hypothetical protein n=1 Tax=Phocaeicola vulgatus TaxID=821 RepID=UPI003565CA23